MLSLAIHGSGRMARAVAAAAAVREDLRLFAVVGPSRPDWAPAPPWFASLRELPEIPGLLVDFSLPEGTHSAADFCASNGVALLSGVTGLPAGVRRALEQAAKTVPVLSSANLSLGVNLLARLVGDAAAALETETPVMVEDVHHQWKKDAPSGTALMLGEAIAARRNGDDSAIDYRSERRGEVIGDHLVRFELEGETLQFSHHAQERGIFARGALDAGCWLAARDPGLYTAQDWLSDRMRGCLG